MFGHDSEGASISSQKEAVIELSFFQCYRFPMTHPIPNAKVAEALSTFLDVIAQLRNPTGGCPWDLKQTFESLRSCLVEESYEISDAVEISDAAVCEELGDLMSIVALYARIAEEGSRFSFASILEGITEKLIRRHPHVFGDVKVSGEAEVLKNWEAIKQQERANQPKKEKGLLDGLPRSMPALMKCHEIGVRCGRVGFDWTSTEGVADKVREELAEFLLSRALMALESLSRKSWFLRSSAICCSLLLRRVGTSVLMPKRRSPQQTQSL